MDRFTPFPTIHSQAGFSGDDGAARAILAWPVDTPHLPNEVLALSWAVLLQAYTTEESPVFLLNDRPIKANLFTRIIQPATLDAHAELSAKHTAVCLIDEPKLAGTPPSECESIESLASSSTTTCTLTWCFNRNTQMSTLHSPTGMDSAFVQQLGRHLEHVMQEQAALSGVQVKLPASADKLSRTEMKLSISNPSPCILPGPQLLHELALSGAHDGNHAIEFLTADGRVRYLSYRALDRMSSNLAAEINAASKLDTEEPRKMVVPVLLPQSLELYISQLAILKAGGAFCPLNIDAPSDRIEFILQDVAASVVITQSALAPRIPQTEHLAVIVVDELETQTNTEETETTVQQHIVKIAPTDLAYVMYTSGSTGRPKGVGISHLAATQSLLAHNDLIPSFTRFLQFASPTFDVSVFEIFFPLFRGATLIGCEREQMLLDISHVMTEMRVDAAELTPTVAGELLRARAAAPYLRVLLTIGEMLTRHVVDEFGQSQHVDGILHGMYGPTEAAIHCTAATHFRSDDRVNLIGMVFKTVSAFIMSLESEDKDASTPGLQPLPLGQVGELVIGGPQLADGYINRPEENAKAFIESPVYGRLYRTGDKARMLPSGEIECFGRISSGQVKLRGQRIELGEIEHAICRAPDVRSAVAIVSSGSLAAFVLVNDKGTTESALRDVCRQWLPRFMVPGEFILVDQFPQLPSGKIDRKALEAEFVRRRNAAQSVEQNSYRDETEETIAACVTDVLGKQLLSTESLSAAGLDSLAAIRLASHLIDVGVRLDVAHLLEADTMDGIWRLAKEAETAESSEDTQAGLQRIRQLVADAGAARIEALGLNSQVAAIEPCSHIQQAMILETTRHKNAYCNWIELEFQKSVSIAAVQEAIFKLVEQNALLRSGFIEIGLKDQPFARFTYHALDKRVFEKRDAFDYDFSLIAEHDLLHPLKFQLKKTPDGLRLLVHIHHALYDGWSWQLMLKDLHRLLLSEDLPPKPAYNVVADFFVEYKLSTASNESLLFWRDQLQGSSPAPFPNFHTTTDVPAETQEATRELQISTSKLTEASQNLRVSRQTIFQAAYCYILSTYLGSDDVTFGTVFSGRTLPVKGIENVLGPCIRTLPIRMRLDKMQNATDLLLAIQNMNLKCLEHGSLPLQDIKKASVIDLQSSLFDTALVWQESIWSDEEYRGMFTEVGAAEFLEFALLLEFEPRDNGIRAKATYQQSVLSREQAEVLLEQIDCVASVLVDDPELAIGEVGSHLPQHTLSVIPAQYQMRDDLQPLVSAIEGLASVDPSRTVVEFLTELESAPPAIESVTYSQLNARANSLAKYLLQKGVTAEDLVAMYMGKSIDSYVALLALAKIGAGLVPFSIKFSSEDISNILSKTNANVCIFHHYFQRPSELAIPDCTRQILFPDSFDDIHDDTPLAVNDGFRLICTDPFSKELVSFSSQSLKRCVSILSESCQFQSESKMLFAHPAASFDSIVGVFLAWNAGVTPCIAPDEALAKDSESVVNAFGVTHLHTTPTIASHLIPQAVPSVQYLGTSGEPLTAKSHRTWAGNGLHYGYSTRGLAGLRTAPIKIETSSLFTSIGKPLKNTSAVVIADKPGFHLLPRGAVGLLCFNGDQLGQSSAEDFFEHPQLGRLYRTRDFGRVLPDGNILQLGQYASSTELDQALLSSELVENSVSLAINNPVTKQQQVVTVWIPSEKAQASSHSETLDVLAKKLMRDLASKLPSSALPALLIPVDEIPMNDAFLTDRASIQQKIQQMDIEHLELFSLGDSNDKTNGDTLTDIEKTIAAALSAVIGVEQRAIGKHTSFYKLGLDSLSAISFSRTLQDCGFGRLPVSIILRHSSVAQLSAVAPVMTNGHQSQNLSLGDSSSVFVRSFFDEVKKDFRAQGATVQGVYLCTPLQEAMLASESDADAAYFNHLLLRIETGVERLKQSWTQMMQRHEILRTCFRQSNEKEFAFVQVVLDTAILPWISVKTSSDTLEGDVARRKSAFEHQSPVDGNLPYSLTIFEDSATKRTHLLLSIHHALYDGEGIAQLLHEIQVSLSGEELSETVPFHRFIEHISSVNSDTSDQFWDRYLSDLSPILIPTSKEVNASLAETASQQVHTSLSQSLASFKRQCMDLSATPLNVFHAAWARLLALHSNATDVCFGNVFSCRTVPLEGAERIVGPCFNTLPVRVKFSSASTNGNVLKLSQKHNNDILPHQLSALRRIQRRVLQGGSRLFDTLVIFQTRSTELDARYWELLADEGNMGFPLICEIVPDEKRDSFHICLHFQTSRLTRDVVEGLARDFVKLVEHTTQYPSAQACDKRVIGAGSPAIFERESPCARINGAPKETGESRPWSDQEEALRDVVCKFADIEADAVSLHTTIFQLGLDSINAVQISGKLRKMGYKISSGDILEAASIDRIAALLDSTDTEVKEAEYDFSAFENRHIQSVCEQLSISLQSVQSLRPCTPVQCGMLALFSHSQGNMYYNRMALNSPAGLNKSKLKEAWCKVMAQHEMLRTGFVQLHDQQHPFAMITYREGIEVPWLESSTSGALVPERQVLENLHQPPWNVSIEPTNSVTTMHFSAVHALYDAQSLERIFADVMAAYEGNTLAQPAPINQTLGPILIESQKQIDNSREFWQGLATEIHPTKFPDLHPMHTDEKKLLASSIRCSQSLKNLENGCRNAGVTLQAAGQAAWARLLAAYTGEQNVVFGTVLSGRNLSTVAQDAVFPCLVTVPSPSRIEGTNRELLEGILRRNASVVKNQFTPLAQIQRWLGSDEPLFDTLFVYQKFSTKSGGSDSWEVVDEVTKIDYPVSIELLPHATDLEVRISCRSDLIPAEQAMILLNQYIMLLEHTIFSPDSSADNYLFLGDQLLSVTPAKEKVIPSTVSLLHQFVEDSASKTPDRTAFEFAFGHNADGLQKKTWSYRAFNEDGNRVAHFLQDKGVVPGGIIAICFDKCPEASLAILGILKAGCAYLAIDPSAPISRKQFIMEDSSTTLLLCNQSRLLELEALTGVDIQALDEPDKYQHFSPAQLSLTREIQPDDTCYCLYTSGTTGTPKGCEITHSNAVQAMLAFQRLFSPHWDEDSRWLQFASFHFDVSVLEQYWSWSVGICVTSCPRDLLFEDLPGTIQKLEITHIDLTPSLARLIHPDEVPSLCRGVFITGGEQLKQEILDAWGEHGVIYNGYGPTEVTIGCTMLPRMRANDKPSNIGPQFDNVGSYVFKPGSCTPVLRGGIGELCVSGPLVGKGYLNRAELTKERFQILPESGDRIYRTGDLVRILHDGSFQFLGRIDDQVKLRGQRLEIGEINEIIKQATPELNEVATLVIKHPKQAKDQLVSFVTRVAVGKKSRDVEVRSSEEDRALLSTIKVACHTHLPGYMVPTYFIPMTKFPLSANNKADMKVLKSIYQDLSVEDLQKLSSMAVQQTAVSTQEKEIVSLLSEFTGTPESSISSWSSIFELGLDSISVISFAKSMREAGFPQAQASLIMKHPTIAGMASALETSASPASRDSLHKNAKQSIEAFAHRNFHSVIENIGVVESDVEQIAPCSPLQEGIIYHFLSSTEPLYCSSFTFELCVSTDIEKLRNAWSKAQDQVQMLRARFCPTSDGYAQVILKHDTLPWFNMSAMSEKEIESLQNKKVENWASDLEELSTRLWEVGLIQSPEKTVMCLSIFHALYDGNSLGLLLDLVARIYLNEHDASKQAPHFLDVLHLGPLCKDPAEEFFWKEHLANCQPRALSTSDQSNGFIESQVHSIKINTTEPLDHLRKALNVTEQAILHACWLLTLHQHYSFVPPIGIIASGRTIDVPGIANVIGPLFNTIPSNVQLRGLNTWSEVARRCHEYQVSTIPFQHTALRNIMKWLGKSPDEQLFDSLFVFQRENADTDASTGSVWQPLYSNAKHEYPLAFEIVRNGNESLTLTLAVKDYVLSAKGASQLLLKFQEILSQFAQNPDHELPCINGVAEESHMHANGETVAPSGMNGAAISSDSSFQWTSQASTIRDVIATLAGVDVQSVSEETSIFEVGLDSIDAIKLSSRLGKLGIKLPVSGIMRCRSVKAMTSQLSEANHNEQSMTYPMLSQMENSLTKFLEKEGLMPQDACRCLPATPIQEAMIVEMAASTYQHYYNHEVLRLEPHVDLARLKEAWRAVVKAHPILRTSFVEIWDPEISVSYAQIVHDENAFDFQSVNLAGKSVESVIESQRRRAASELAGRPLLSLTTAIDEDAQYLVLSICHALYDGWSISLLHEDVAKSYAGEDCTRPSSDAILEQILASSGDRALRFWRATLSNCKPIAFPASKHADSGTKLVHRAERPLSVSVNKVEDFCKRHGITMQALFVSCWSLVLASYVKNLDVVFGLVLSGRNVADSENVMFPTMNTVAMRVILHGTRLELVKYVQETLLEMSEHQHFPLRRAKPDTKSRQLFDTLFIYQKRPSEAQSQKPALYQSTGGEASVEYPVCAEVEADGKDLVGRVACRGSVLGEKDTFVLLSRLTESLLSVVGEPAGQTIEFSGDFMKICGSVIIPEDSGQSGELVPPTAEKTSQRTWSTVESKIRNVLSIVSGVSEESIDKEANIFQLGLDSISAIKVSALLKKQSVKLNVSDMLKAGTIEKMALAVNQSEANITQREVDYALEESLKGIEVKALLQSYGIDQRDTEITLPATAGQTYFLAMHSLNPEVFYPKFYYLASAQFNPQFLNCAWSRLIDETPMLRTAFLATGNSQVPYMQTVLKSVRNPPTWHDDLHHAISIRHDFGSVPVALHVCQTSRGVAFMLHLHHALYDAVGLPLMMGRLAQLCSEFKSEPRHGSHNLSQFVAFQHIHSPVDIRQKFWKKYLGQISTPDSRDNLEGKFGTIRHDYRPGLVSNMSQLEIAAKLRGLSIQSIFLAVYARVHVQVFASANVDNETASQPLVVGLYLANRLYSMEGLSELVAPTVNIVPLRLDDKLSNDYDSLFDAARKIQEDINEISLVEHAPVSLIEIAEWTGVHISTCINFLRLPELEDSNGDASHRVTFQSISSDEVAPLRLCSSRHSPLGSAQTNGDTVLSDSVQPTGSAATMAAMKELFWPTIDVEAAVREDRLDFGLFAPDTRLDRSTAEKVMEAMRNEMTTLIASSEFR